MAYFRGILAVLRKKARFRFILTHFEAIFGLHLAARGPTGQLWAQNWGAPSEPTAYPGHFRWVFNSQGGGGLFITFRPFLAHLALTQKYSVFDDGLCHRPGALPRPHSAQRPTGRVNYLT